MRAPSLKYAGPPPRTLIAAMVCRARPTYCAALTASSRLRRSFMVSDSPLVVNMGAILDTRRDCGRPYLLLKFGSLALPNFTVLGGNNMARSKRDRARAREIAERLRTLVLER